ncbi:MAG TPA: hypothetical protein VFS00_34635, partial [Polyangiaceae bacterium]|nr:hypothetical protein [Polyangiaceae bacterium]
MRAWFHRARRASRARRALACLGLWAATLAPGPAAAQAPGAAKPGAARPGAPKPGPAGSKGAGAKGPAAKGPAKGAAAPNGARPGVNEAARRAIAGAPTVDEASKGVESPELRALRAAEQELFSAAAPAPGAPWPSDWSFPAPLDPARPRVRAAGLPPASPPPAARERGPEAEAAAWARSLKLPPGLPVRWEPRLVKYLVFFRDDPRGRQ